MKSSYHQSVTRTSASSSGLLAAWLTSSPVKVLGACLLLAVAAQVRVPLWWTPVPMTLQLLAVLMIGFALAPAEAVGATVSYVILGSVGLRVFTPGSAGLAGPTGGYLIGFILAAWLISVLSARRNVGFGRRLTFALAGSLIVLLVGVAWLALGLSLLWDGFDGELGGVLRAGLVPFLPKAALEAALAATAAGFFRRRRVGQG